jgi:hypothetical protein
MFILDWSNPEDRVFETGLDRAVIYSAFGNMMVGQAWPGLTSVEEDPNYTVSSTVFDGVPINQNVVSAGLTGSIKAYSSPPALDSLFIPGVSIGQQAQRPKALVFRTKKGSALNQDLGYILHLIPHIVLVPKAESSETESDSIDAKEFEWDFVTSTEITTGVGNAPLASIKVDTTKANPDFVVDLENRLYGNAAAGFPTPHFPTFAQLTQLIGEYLL